MDKIIVIPISASILLLCASWFVTRSNCNHVIKIIMIFIFGFAGFNIWYAIPKYMGYATVEELPDEFILVWAQGNENGDYIEVLMEPNSTTNVTKGVLSYKPDFMEKRFYRIKFDQKLSDSLNESMEKVNKGAKIAYKKEKGTGGAKGKGGAGEGFGEFVPHDTLPPGMPPKD